MCFFFPFILSHPPLSKGELLVLGECIFQFFFLGGGECLEGVPSDLELGECERRYASFEGNRVTQLAHHLNYVSNMNFSAHTGPHPGTIGSPKISAPQLGCRLNREDPIDGYHHDFNSHHKPDGPSACTKKVEAQIHLGRLTWNIPITHLERKMIFQTPRIMFHVNLPGCIHTPPIGMDWNGAWNDWDWYVRVFFLQCNFWEVTAGKATLWLDQ